MRLLALFGLLAIAYSNSFLDGFVLDDTAIVAHDPRIRQATAPNVASILSGGYRYSNPTVGLYRPLTTLTYLLNYAVLGNGGNPAGYHSLNLGVHAVNVTLVYALGIAIFAEAAPAWALAAIWGLHPILTESITNIVGRADLLAAFGVLAGLHCYLLAISMEGRRRIAWIASVAAAQAIGIFSKESAIVLPGLMLAFDLTWLDRSTWRRRAPAYAALALPLGVFFYQRSQMHLHLVIPFADNPLVNAGFWQARFTAVEVLGKFLWLFLWPARLSADYSYNAIPLLGSTPPDPAALLAIAAVLFAAVLFVTLAVRHRHTQKPALFFLAFFFLAALPTSNLLIFIGSIMAERFLYLPSIGLAGFAIAALYTLAQRHARIACAALAIVCLAFIARTYARNVDWKDDLYLWTSATAVSPGSAKVHYNLGKVFETQPARLSDAIAQYRASLQIDPDEADAHNNLANALLAIPGHLPEAIAEYRTAIRLQPDRSEPHNNLANALAQISDRLPEAIAEYQTALRIEPTNAEIHYNLANALARLPSRLSDAIGEYHTALRVDPNHADARINLGHALVAQGNSLTPDRLAEAIAEYNAALQANPDDVDAHYDLGVALSRLPGRLPDAILEFQSALRTQPGFFEAHVNLANAFAQTPGRLSEAIAEYEAALRIRHDPVLRQMLERLRVQFTSAHTH